MTAEVRTERIEVRATPDERAVIAQAAAERGLSVSSWVRSVLLIEATSSAAARATWAALTAGDPLPRARPPERIDNGQRASGVVVDERPGVRRMVSDGA